MLVDVFRYWYFFFDLIILVLSFLCFFCFFQIFRWHINLDINSLFCGVSWHHLTVFHAKASAVEEDLLLVDQLLLLYLVAQSLFIFDRFWLFWTIYELILLQILIRRIQLSQKWWRAFQYWLRTLLRWEASAVAFFVILFSKCFKVSFCYLHPWIYLFYRTVFRFLCFDIFLFWL